MNNEIAYLVTQGVYSSYTIVKVFLDKELAENFVRHHNTLGCRGGPLQVDEYPIERIGMGIGSDHECSVYQIEAQRLDPVL